VTIAAAARQSAQNIALSELGRQAVMADPDWRGGAYYSHGVRPAKGLAVARVATQVASFSEANMRARLGAASERERFAFNTDYSPGAATTFVERFDANSYLYLSRAMDTFDLASDFGGRLANAFQGGATRHCVFAFTSDWRFPPSDSRAVARALIAAGADAGFVEIESDNGHDAYLAEEPQFEAALTGFIDATAATRGLSLNGGA
jgi:homoserine O-acetyltransferase